MSGRLLIISGPSGCGKTTLLNSLCRLPLARGLRTVKAPKYSTRAERGPDDDVRQLFSGDGIPTLQLGYGPFFDKNGSTVEVGETGIDIAYALNKNVYGISSGQIGRLLSSDKNVLIILSDFRIIRRLLQALPGRVIAVYIASAIDPLKLEMIETVRHGIPAERRALLETLINRLKSACDLELWPRVTECVGALQQYWEENKPGADATNVRAERIRAFHTRYIEHITLFDYVILNYTEDAPEEMTGQMRSIILKHSKFERDGVKYPPIFVVAAASGAGKGTLMQMLGLIGNDRVRLVSKLGLRPKKGNDKRDGMLAIGTPDNPPEGWPDWPDWWTDDMVLAAKRGVRPAVYDLCWEFHKREGRATRYAVSSTEIDRNIAEGVPQILISNMGQFEMFRQRYGERVVFVYLYRLSSAGDTAAWYSDVNPDKGDAETRILEIREVHEEYLERIAEFDHVLLNTARKEDLYDQMFQLLEYYYNFRCDGGPNKPME